MSIEKKVELSWVNYIKLLCMVLVYMNHSETYVCVRFEVLRHFYGPIFVNTFFVVSGYLLFRKQLSGDVIVQNRKEWWSGGGGLFASNILYKLAIPSVLFAAILFLPKQIVRGHEFDITAFLHDTIMGGSMWFTSALAVAELMIFLMLLTRARSIWPYLLFGSITAFISYLVFRSEFSLCEDPHVPWYYRSGLSAVLFMACGGVYWKYEKIIDSFFNTKSGIFLGILIMIYISWGVHFYPYFSGNLYAPLNLPTVFIVVVGSYLLIRLCKILPSAKQIDYLGRHSIGLYFISGALPNTLAVLFKKVFPQAVILPLSTWIVSLLIAIPIVILINRYIPFMYDLRLLKKNVR